MSGYGCSSDYATLRKVAFIAPTDNTGRLDARSTRTPPPVSASARDRWVGQEGRGGTALPRNYDVRQSVYRSLRTKGNWNEIGMNKGDNKKEIKKERKQSPRRGRKDVRRNGDEMMARRNESMNYGREESKRKRER